MAHRIWYDVIPVDEINLYKDAGFGRRGGFGESLALLIIDVQYRTVGSEPKPIREAMSEYLTACGEDGWKAVGHIQRLLEAVRAAKIPVLYPYVAPKETVDAGRLGVKVPTIMSIPQRGYDFVAEIAPQPGDILLPKRHASAFFGTPIVSYLIDLGVDTIVVVGCTTSGCVRATVADGFSYNFRVVIPEECVYDRSPTSHTVNLFDMNYKYGDVVSLDVVLNHIKGLRD